MQQQASGNPAGPLNPHPPNPHQPVHHPHGLPLPQPPPGPPLLLGQGAQGLVQGIQGVQGVQGVVGINLGGLPGALLPGQEPPHLHFPPNM